MLTTRVRRRQGPTTRAVDLGGAGQEPRPRRRATSDVIRDAWVRFARTGSPTESSADWPRYTTTDEHHLEILDTVEIRSGWRSLELDAMATFLGGSG